jgi:hypothetical protein
MRFWIKIGLFLSAYLPLFLILALKNWLDCILLAILCIVFFYSLVWGIMLFVVKKSTSESFIVAEVENHSQDSLSYLVPYIISFMNFDFDKWNDYASLGILLIIIFYIYINSNLLYINPLLHFFNYRFYRIEAYDCEDIEKEHKLEINLISKHIVKLNEKIAAKEIDRTNNVFLGADE